MNRYQFQRARRSACVPRASGDEPRHLRMDCRRRHVFPAPAGMNRYWMRRPACGWSVPRASGDEPGNLIDDMVLIVRVPRASGDEPRLNSCAGLGP